MECVLEVLNADGHLALWWDPDVPDTVAAAKAEFERLRGLGYSFFESDDATDPVNRLTPKRLREAGTLSVRRVETFSPRARRTVAVRPLRGG